MSSAAPSPQLADPDPTASHERYIERAQQRDEPTLTRTLRSTYAQRLRGRWAAIMAAIRTAIVENDALALQTEALVDAPERFPFQRDPERVPAFDRWLSRQTDREILEQYGRENQWVASSYERGVDDARTELRALGLTESTDVAATALQLPVHRDQLQALYARNFGALQGMTDATANQMRRVLTEGLASGDGPREIARDLADRVDKVGITRANTIARTEIMNSMNSARLQEWERAGIKKVDVLLAPDACSQCQAYKAGAPYSASEAYGNLPQHPNCRCTHSVYTADS